MIQVGGFWFRVDKERRLSSSACDIGYGVSRSASILESALRNFVQRALMRESLPYELGGHTQAMGSEFLLLGWGCYFDISR